MTAQKSTRNLVIFFLLAFAISWLLWLPAVLNSNDIAQLPAFTGILSLFFALGPFIAAFWLTWREGGREAIKKLGKRGWSLDFDKKWLIPAVFLMPAISLVTVAVLMLMGQSIEWEYAVPMEGLLIAFVFIFLLQAVPEEYGWRGYALGRLLAGRNALVVSLILGVIWGLWHLPLHFIDGSVQENIPIYQFLLNQAVLAILFTWLYVNTRGAVSIAILFHTIGNLTSASVPTWTTDVGRWTGFVVMLVFAAAIALFWGPGRLSRSQDEYDASIAAVESE